MRIWHISDTHSNHDQLTVPENIDLVIHSGDATNHRDPARNEPEMHKFLVWFAALPVKHKVFVAGNHDTSIEKGMVLPEYIKSCGIHYLYNGDVTIDGLKIWGSPFTPTFGDWAFTRNRSKIIDIWRTIPMDTDILVTHGPPKGILDITNRSDNLQEQCGDSALLKVIWQIQPKLVCFGHIHNCAGILNAGVRQIAGLNTVFSNGACCTDRRWGVITSHGNVLSGIAPAWKEVQALAENIEENKE